MNGWKGKGWPQRFTINPNSHQAKGLIAWWPMLGDAGAADLVGHVNGVLTNGASRYDDGQHGRVMQFDGDNDYLELGTIPANHPLQLANNHFTISFWAYQSTPGDDYQRIIDKSDGGGGQNGWCIFLSAGVGPRRVWVQVDGVTELDSDTSVYSYNTWHHFVVTADGSGSGGAIYVDGLAVGLNTNTSFTMPNAATNARIGTWNHSTAREFGGYLYDLRIYNRKMDAAEAYQLYDERTRWELFKPLPVFFVAAAVTSTDLSISVSDTIALSDSATVDVSDPAISVSDTLAISDAPSVTRQEATARAIDVTDTAALSDSSTVDVSDPSISTSDILALSDSASAEVSAPNTSILDTLALSDSPTVTRQEATARTIDVTDTTALSDAPSVTRQEATARTIDVTDTAALSDSPSVALGVIGELTILVSDTVALSDNVDVEPQIYIDISPLVDAYLVKSVQIV